MAGFKRYRKDDPVSYSLGITLTFELLRYKTEYVNKVYVHSAMKEGETYDKLRRICGEAGIPIQQTDKIFHVLSKKENCYVIGEFRKFEDVLDPKVFRASMGAIFSTQFQYFDSFDEYLEQFGERELYPFMLQAKITLPEISPSGTYSLIFGNEATGLPREFLDIGTSVIIPHSDRIDSLNLPIAASIAMYAAHSAARR